MRRKFPKGRRGLKAPRGTRPRYHHPKVEELEQRDVPALSVTDLTMGLTPTQLVNNLLGTGVTVSNVKFTGAPVAAGTFTGGTGIIGFESGIVLSTGHAVGVVGPNVAANEPSPSFDNGQPSDPQLDTLIPNPPGFDAAVLEFDFIPQGSTLDFNFVFSSEEYNEFVGQSFHDAFGFFVNGQNTAFIPGTTTPINVNTVNLTINQQFYINNATTADPTPATPPLLNTDMDGLTVVLPIHAAVNPGVVNHIKLGIEDAGDPILDSDVFIQAGSFSAPPGQPPPTPPTPASLNAYRPLRYAFRSLQGTFAGNVTVLNVGQSAATGGSVTVDFVDLPQGVTIVNATGKDTSGDPTITVPVSILPADVPLRIAVVAANPLRKPLGTFFVGPYFLLTSSP
jgi:hypothetical protein